MCQNLKYKFSYNGCPLMNICNIDLFMGSLLIHFGQGVMTVAVCSIQYVPPLRRKSAPMIIVVVGPVVW